MQSHFITLSIDPDVVFSALDVCKNNFVLKISDDSHPIPMQ